jgi:hypothetical protein
MSSSVEEITVSVSAPPAPPRVDVSGYNGPTMLDDQIRLAEVLATATRVIPVDYRDQPGDLLALIYEAQALNIPVMTAVHNLYFEDDGSYGMSAQLIGALLRRGGADWSTTIEQGKSCTLVFTFADGRTGGEAKYTIGDALRAEIANTTNWIRYPDDNLYARAVSQGARRFAQDLTGGLAYVPGERTTAPAVQEEAVDPDVAEFLAQADGASTTQIQALTDTALAKKSNGLAAKPAGGGKSVEDRLRELWLAAAARELAAATAPDADAGEPAPEPDPQPAAVPGDGHALTAPAGEGDLPCRCPAAAVLATGEHDPAVCLNTAAVTP